MNVRALARALGRRGGRARARRLSPERRREIASMGGRARALARLAERRIADNFRILGAIEDLSRGRLS